MGAIDSLEVEEHLELPSALELSLPVMRTEAGDLAFVNEKAFQPFANLAVVVTADGQSPECIFDGYVLSQRLHLEQGAAASRLTVFGQDISFRMNLEERVREWSGMTDAGVAKAIFEEHGFVPAQANDKNDSGAHVEGAHTLMQRASDIQFLRALARRTGKLCRVACGARAGEYTGYFVTPKLEGDPAVTLSLQAPEGSQIAALDFEWDVTRPTAVTAAAAVFHSPDEDGANGDTEDSGLPLLSDRSLADFSGQTTSVALTTNADDAGELLLRSASLVREASFFAKCNGTVDLDVVGRVMRVGTLAAINGAGTLNSGNYLIWNVRHSIKPQRYTLGFGLVRNAVGTPPGGLP